LVRKLDPLVAFLLSVVGAGFLYVGQLWLGVATLLGFIVGIYLMFLLLVALLVMQWVVPTLIAWRKKEVPAKRYNRWYFYLAWVIGVQLLLELWVSHNAQTSGFKIFSVPSDGMASTLQRGDWVAADTWRYREHDPAVGDIVSFWQEDMVFTKRVVGVPGDTIEIRHGVLFRNNQSVKEPYIHAEESDQPYGRDISPITLGPGELFVLGDHRDNSIDSRRFGAIDKTQLIGRMETICFAHQGLRVEWDRFHRVLTNDT